jgi:VWFA-related protein
MPLATIARRHAPALALAALTLFLAASSGVSGGESETPQSSGAQSTATTPTDPQQPTFRTGTNYVRVDVYPMKDGKPLQGLKAEDFEILEDGVPQRIEAFEHVLSLPSGPQETRREPGSQRESLQQAANPRSRVFVVFLDGPNVTVAGSHNIKEPVIRLIDRIVGPDDLVAIMTPDMSTSNLVLARKTQVLAQQLRENWAWGTRFGLLLDEREQAYHACYPPLPHERGHHSELTRALIARKRERATFEALQDLVRWLHGVREERKAIITVTEGWVRYRPAPELMQLRQGPGYKEPIPGPEVIGVGPTGKLTTSPTRELDPDLLSKRECDTDRMRLANMDNEQFFRQIVDDANRGNASFYPVDPRGLPVFDSPIGPDAPPPPSVDQAILRERLESMHDLALGTDGIAVLNNNDLDAGLRRIGDDLTSYYLLGYYSTNAKLDGKFRRLEVKVKQPGVNVRARRGYRAPTAEEVAAARVTSEPAEPSARSAFDAAMGTLGRIRPDARFRINAAARSVDGGDTTIWVAGELLRGAAGSDDFAQGATAEIEVRAGTASTSSRISLQPGERGFLTSLTLAAGSANQVQVRARLSAEGAALPLMDAIDADVGAGAAQPLLYRRGPATANKVVPAADFLFSRGERLRFEVPIASTEDAGAGRVLDRAGQPLKIPVRVAQHTDDATGQRWLTADITLAPLAAGDYAVELTTSSGSTTRQIITAIRVTR